MFCHVKTPGLLLDFFISSPARSVDEGIGPGCIAVFRHRIGGCTVRFLAEDLSFKSDMISEYEITPKFLDFCYLAIKGAA